jgi:cleavage and polyadenylation specificity factor subunit 3
LAISIRTLGSELEIGDSSYLLTLDGVNLLFDAGVHPRREGLNSLPDYHKVTQEDVDAILISHCHLDHLGSLPVALSYFPHARVLMSEASAVLAPLMLHHTAKVMNRLVAEGIYEEPLFSGTDVDLISYIFQGMDGSRPFSIHSLENHKPDLQARFYDAGHILGAAGIWIESPTANVFYTGDTSAHNQEIISGAIYPEGPVDLLIAECTLGSDPRSERRRRRDEIRRFARAINSVIGREGTVLIPAFALGRTQEMLALLHRLRSEARIPDVEIYTAGFGGAVSEIYDRTSKYTRRQLPRVRLEELDVQPVPRGSLKRCRFLREPSIVLVSSGMMAAGTLSNKLAQIMLPDARHGIFFVGYVDPDMPGHRVLVANQGGKVQLAPDASEVGVQCQRERFHFSAHSNRRDLLKLVDRLLPKTILLAHGEHDSIHWMKQALSHRHPGISVILPEKDRTLTIR